MGAGRVWPAEWREYADPVTGATVRQLTDYLGHSHHLYFTNPGWHDGGRRMLFGSDRENRTNLFSIDLAGGEITQLTDLEPLPRPHHLRFQRTCLNPVREEAYFWYGRHLVAIDLRTFAQRALWETPPGFLTSMINCTADGRYVCGSIFEDLSARFPVDYDHGFVGFRETWAAHPTSRIFRIDTDGGRHETVREERNWIAHVNTSPTQPHLLTFCHEGPWEFVDNRIWGLDLSTGAARPIRRREEPQMRIGHEYWHADGIHLGYHGNFSAEEFGGRGFFGRVRYDDTERVEVDFPHLTGHIHSNDFALVVGDAGRVVRLWRWNGESFDGPHALCEHRSSAHVQATHVHPRFAPDGASVVYTSDASGYGNVYVAAVPEFGSLPAVTD